MTNSIRFITAFALLALAAQSRAALNTDDNGGVRRPEIPGRARYV